MRHKKQTQTDVWALAALGAIVVVAALLRFWALRWALPGPLHEWTYHPDEIFQVGAMARVFSSGLDPGFYSYPSGYLNIGAGALAVANGYGMSWQMLVGPYMVARSVAAVMGVLTVPAVYGIGNRLYGKPVGLLGALIMAIIPLHVVHSHFATVDVPAALWVAVAMLLAGLIFTRPTLAVYIGAGAAAGFALGTKYNVALVIVPVMVAHFVREGEDGFVGRLKDGRLWFAIVTFVIGFFVSTPGWLFWPRKFLYGDDNGNTGLLYELHHVATGHGLVFVGRGPGWLDVVTNSLGYGLGVFLLVLTLCGIAYAIVRHKRADWILLSFLIPYFLMMSLSEVRFARYAIPMLPILAVLVARMADGVFKVLDEQRARFLKWVWVGIVACVIGYTAVYAIAFDGLFAQSDPRDRVYAWFEDGRQGVSIGMPTVPWFYSAPFEKSIIGTPGEKVRYNAMTRSRYKLIAHLGKDWDAEMIAREKPEYVVMSDYEYGDPQRLHLTEFEQFSHELNDSYTEVKVFRSEFSACGVDFGPTEYLPHDLKYMAPTIRVYRRK